MAKLKYFKGSIFMMKVAALFPISPRSSAVKKVLYEFYTFLFLASFVTTAVQIVVYLSMRKFDLVEEAVVIMDAVITYCVFLNPIVFYLKRPALREMIKSVNELFVYETDNGFETINMKYANALSNKMILYTAVVYIVTTIVRTSVPLLGSERILPMTVWHPYNWTVTPNFELAYAWQYYTQANLAISYETSDMVYPCVMILLVQQFKILRSNLNNSFYYSLIKCGSQRSEVLNLFKTMRDCPSHSVTELRKHHSDIFRTLDSYEFRKVNLEYLKKNIKHHQALLKCSEDINAFFNVLLMGKIISAVLYISFIAFSVLTMKDQTIVVGLLSYGTAAIMQLFVYNCTGQYLTEYCDISKTIYKTPWFLIDDMQYKKICLMIQIRCSRDLYTRAGNYFRMSFSTFITVMKTILSYVALMRELTKNK